ncbi:MAG: hypothetical protein J6A04_01770 [Clostridia bacterium]|nr:hypothetical protein [Clostridia bacterium]
MNIDSMKNIVVLKDLPSNMVEEAIVILKPNIKIENIQKEEKKKENVKVGAKVGSSKEYIIKEAEEIVSQYISNLEKPKQLEITNKKLIAKYHRIRTLTILFGMVGAFGIIVNFI